MVNKDVNPFAFMVSVPAKQIGWMSEYGEQIDLPLEGEGAYIYLHTGSQYRLEQGQLTKKGFKF